MSKLPTIFSLVVELQQWKDDTIKHNEQSNEDVQKEAA